MNRRATPSLYWFLPESPARDAAIALITVTAEGDRLPHPSRYFMLGYDDFRDRGWRVATNIGGSGGSVCDTLLCKWGRLWFRLFAPALNGRWPVVARGLASARKADWVISGTDAIGLPLAALKKWRRFSPRLLYVSVGLPERLEKLDEKKQRYARDLLREVDVIVAYGWGEAERLKRFIGEGAPGVRFIPFGVDTDLWRPITEKSAYDIACIGGDPQRDVDLFFALARSMPEKKCIWITTAWLARSYGALPPNVERFVDIPLEQVHSLMAQTDLVALPIKENSYSGATTTLLQAMAMGKLVVLSRTEAVREGYGLRHDENVLMCEPGDREAFITFCQKGLDDEALRLRIGSAARNLAETRLSWNQFTANLEKVINDCA